MIDDNWELIDGEAAHQIEVLNYANQVNVIEALVRFLIHHNGVGPNGCPGCPNLKVLSEFHRTATLFLLAKPGEFRDEGVVVQKGGVVVFTPPPHEDVDGHMNGFHAEMCKRWLASSAVEMGAYVLWLVNWVHPFKNGNGRSARAFSYACISLKLGFVLPGTPTVIDLVMQNRDDYERALAKADAGFAASGEPDLGDMVVFIEGLLVQQLSSI